MKVQEIIAYYEEHPPRLTNRRAGELIARFGCTMDDVIQARELFQQRKEESTSSLSQADIGKELDYDVEGQRLKAKLILDSEALTEEEIYKFFNLDPLNWTISRMWGIWKSEKYHLSVFFKPRAGSVIGVDILESIRKVAAEVKLEVPELTPVSPEDEPKELYAVMCMFDAHLGRYAKEAYTGESFSLETIIPDYYNALLRMIQEVPLHKVKKFVLPIGNDFFNVDNYQLGTTRGTPQDNPYDLKQMFQVGLKFITQAISYMSRFAPVDVILVPGNHDNLTSTYMAIALEEMFSANTNVTVDSDPIDRKYRLYGKTLLTFTHGELDANKLSVLIPHEAKALFCEATYYECLQGHLHHEKRQKQPEIECGGIVIRNLAGMTKKDRWTFKEGYTLSTKRAYTIMYHETEGRKMEVIHNL